LNKLEIIAKFIDKTCGCKKLSGEACSKTFTASEYLLMRQESQNINFYNENHINKLDVAILAELHALIDTSELNVNVFSILFTTFQSTGMKDLLKFSERKR